jgi:phosphate transport system protein
MGDHTTAAGPRAAIQRGARPGPAGVVSFLARREHARRGQFMPTTHEGFDNRIELLKAGLVEQGRRVQGLIEAAFDAAFARDAAAAERVIALDEEVDRVDVALERSSVQLLTDATNEGAALDPRQLRMVLTIVKVNNELERIADAGVYVAEQVPGLRAVGHPLPDTFRVMANSVVGILRDTNTALDRLDGRLARVVLASQDAVGEFKRALMRDGAQRVATGAISVDFAFTLQEVATACEDMADHCTNISEQVLYTSSGAIVRHMHGHWEDVPSVQ